MHVYMHVDVLFDGYFDFVGVKTKINKNGRNLINLEVPGAIKTKNNCYMISNR